MNAGDIVYSDNGRHWRLVQEMGAGFWMAHAMTDEATHIRGISPPLHIISEKHVTLSPQNAVIECTETIADTAEAKNVKLREALEYYAKHYDWPADGPWGATSTDFGDKARAALSEHEKE